jgi:antitoxin (DNA-binding transcriptional repressor) of toxin-antitoxin stability system
MKVSATVTEVLRNFSDYINHVSYRGERFVLTRGGKVVAELVPAPPAGRRCPSSPTCSRRFPAWATRKPSASPRTWLAAAPHPWPKPPAIRGHPDPRVGIAATAVSHGLTLATANRRDFDRIPGLAVESW